VADAIMGVDNVLAIGGAASGSIVLIVMGSRSACRSSCGAAIW
jgi:predicted tellurium resistance membrane protein TerC